MKKTLLNNLDTVNKKYPHMKSAKLTSKKYFWQVLWFYKYWWISGTVKITVNGIRKCVAIDITNTIRYYIVKI